MADPTYRHLCDQAKLHKYKAWGANSCDGGSLAVHLFSAPAQHNCSRNSASLNSSSISCEDTNGASMGKVLFRVLQNGDLEVVRDNCKPGYEPPPTARAFTAPAAASPLYLYAWVCCEPSDNSKSASSQSLVIPIIVGAVLLTAVVVSWLMMR